MRFKPCKMSEFQDHLAYKFYAAFSAKDILRLKDYYHEELKFEDPAFGPLNKEKTVAMWTMLFESGSDLHVDFEILQASDEAASVQWTASYSFGSKKRKVVNHIKSHITFADGKIITHKDEFNLHNWAKQALGFSGWLLGGTAYFRKKLQAKTQHRLDKYMAVN